MWKNIAELDGSHLTIWRKPVACWVTMATNALSENKIFFAFPLQQWLHERALMLR
jgi:hypothetical protein